MFNLADKLVLMDVGSSPMYGDKCSNSYSLNASL